MEAEERALDSGFSCLEETHVHPCTMHTYAHICTHALLFCCRRGEPALSPPDYQEHDAKSP